MNDQASHLNSSHDDPRLSPPGGAEIALKPVDTDLIFDRVERAKQEWEATVDSLPELVCVIDEHGCIVRANRTIEAWHLGDVTAIQGFSLHTLLHPGCLALYCGLDRYLRQETEAAQAGTPAPLETYDTFLNRYLRVRVQPVTARRPNLPITAVIVIEDITEHHQREQALHRSMTRLTAVNDIQRSILAAQSPQEIATAALLRLRALVAFRQARVVLCDTNAGDFIVLTADANGSTHLLPSQACTRAELQFDRNHALAEAFNVDDLLEIDYPSPFEWRLVSDGMRSLVNMPLLAEKRFIGALLLASDRCAAFKPEELEAAREIVDSLAIAMHQARLYRQLQQTNLQLHSALRAKDEMIANVSHELRTPLGVIYGYAQLLADGGLGPLTAEQVRATNVMCDESERLRKMVNRLVRLAGLNKTDVQRVPLDLAAWLPSVIDRWQTHLYGSHFQLEADWPTDPLPVCASPDHLKEVVDNLVENAVKFSPRGSTIRLQVWREDDRIYLSVADEGIGIAADDLAQVFERFYQVDGSSTREYGGMGIGLALCYGIVATHGGRIWAESEGEGHGSTFYVALPLAEPEPGNRDSEIRLSHSTQDD